MTYLPFFFVLATAGFAIDGVRCRIKLRRLFEHHVSLLKDYRKISDRDAANFMARFNAEQEVEKLERNLESATKRLESRNKDFGAKLTELRTLIGIDLRRADSEISAIRNSLDEASIHVKEAYTQLHQ